MIDAPTQFEHQYHEMRWRILSLAADLDRLQRLPGGDGLLADDQRLRALRACLDELKSPEPGRAERVQLRLSDASPAPAKAAS